jgi:FtsP/CotA-like multicopper oxidase with cupredoxin domain
MKNAIFNANFSANRRSALRLAAASGASGLLGAAATSRQARAADLPPGPYTEPFAVALPVPAVKKPVTALNPAPGVAPGVSECGRESHQAFYKFPPRKFYRLRVKEGLHSFHPQLPTQTIWGYDGLYPGPTFVSRYGEPALVRIYNDLPPDAVGFGSPEISTHLHNLHQPSESDGYAGNYYSRTVHGPTLTGPGAYQDHHYPNCYAGYDKYGYSNGDPREGMGTLWYHDHRLDFTAGNVYRGLAGFYLLFDPLDSGNERDTSETALRLPSGVGVYDIPLVLQDRQFDANGYLYFDQFEDDGFLGNKMCVNGKIQPYFNVERRKYRFRLLNGATARNFELYLTQQGENRTFTYIGNDGNLLPRAIRDARRIEIAPAERAEIVIDFSQYPIGTELFLVNRLIQTNGRMPEGPLTNVRDSLGDLVDPGTPMLRFFVERNPARPDRSRVPDFLRPLPPISMSEVVATRHFEFDRENDVWTVNHQIFDVETPAFTPKLGSAEIWTLEGKGSWVHPIHLHLEEFRILSRNGVPPPLHESGRKDTVALHPGEIVRIFIRFRDFTGKYVMHCHNLNHEDHSMMLRFDVVP